jgi:hypothetical protein
MYVGSLLSNWRVSRRLSASKASLVEYCRMVSKSSMTVQPWVGHRILFLPPSSSHSMYWRKQSSHRLGGWLHPLVRIRSALSRQTAQGAALSFGGIGFAALGIDSAVAAGGGGLRRRLSSGEGSIRSPVPRCSEAVRCISDKGAFLGRGR